jgi:hypothetical protein
MTDMTLIPSEGKHPRGAAPRGALNVRDGLMPKVKK